MRRETQSRIYKTFIHETCTFVRYNLKSTENMIAKKLYSGGLIDFSHYLF